jgi:Fic family protein
MVYVEHQKKGEKDYYYVTKNFRISGNKWRKIRRYCSSKPPSKQEIAEILKEIDKTAKEKGWLKEKPAFKYLSDSEVETLQDVKDAFKNWYGKLDAVEKKKYEDDFLVRFTYNSNAIEGNRLSLRETSMILTENIIPSGVSTQDYNEALNGKDCLEFIRNYKGNLGKKVILKVHKTLTKNTGCRLVGEFRDSRVRISGSDWIPPAPEKVEGEIKEMLVWWANNQNKLHPVELAGILHNRMVRTHPFTDGNGRTARMLMNWALHKKGYPMFTIENKEKMEYYKAIEEGDKGQDMVFIHYLTKTLINQHTFKSKQ